MTAAYRSIFKLIDRNDENGTHVNREDCRLASFEDVQNEYRLDSSVPLAIGRLPIHILSVPLADTSKSCLVKLCERRNYLWEALWKAALLGQTISESKTWTRRPGRPSTCLPLRAPYSPA